MENCRRICLYSPTEARKIQNQKYVFLEELTELQKKNKLLIFENQYIIASHVVDAFSNLNNIITMVLAKTQSGKTGSMCATIEEYLKKSSNIIPIENIYIITGLSSRDWKIQTKARMPKSIQQRIFHRSDLTTTFLQQIQEKKNVLIIVDEVQVAAKKEQTLHKFFDQAGFMDKIKMYENDIKFIFYTATPDGIIYDMKRWENAVEIILAEAGEGYVSCYDLLQEGRVKQFKPISVSNKFTFQDIKNNIQELKQDIDSYASCRYHIIRTKKGKWQEKTMQSFRKIFHSTKYTFQKYDITSGILDINEVLQIKPLQHTLIFIKDRLRCAKTICKKYLGVLYERFSENPDDSVIIQGLIGRDTGYDNNRESICYTNISSIERYEELWQSNFEDKNIQWNSKTTKFNKGVIESQYTFNGNDEIPMASEPTVIKFKTQEEVKEYFQLNLEEKFQSRGPNWRKPNADGIFEARVGTKKGIFSCAEILRTHKRYVNKKQKFALYPCYEDKNDKTTLQFLLIHS